MLRNPLLFIVLVVLLAWNVIVCGIARWREAGLRI